MGVRAGQIWPTRDESSCNHRRRLIPRFLRFVGACAVQDLADSGGRKLQPQLQAVLPSFCLRRSSWVLPQPCFQLAHAVAGLTNLTSSLLSGGSPFVARRSRKMHSGRLRASCGEASHRLAICNALRAPFILGCSYESCRYYSRCRAGHAHVVCREQPQEQK